MPWWWLSFADDSGCLGVAIIQGDSIEGAVNRANALDINPGGEVLGYSADTPADLGPYETDVLLSPDALSSAGELRMSQLTDEERGYAEANAAFIHDGCNDPR